MNWVAYIRDLRPGRAGQRRGLAEAGDATAPTIALADEDLDTALRYTLHAEVAGAAPRSDAWMRLERRIHADAPDPIWVQQPGTLGLAHPLTQRTYPLVTTFLPRFSQISVAGLMLLLMLSGTWVLPQAGGPVGTPVPLHLTIDNPPAALPLVRPPNRAQQIMDGEDSAAPVAAPPPPADVAPPPVAVASVPDGRDDPLPHHISANVSHGLDDTLVAAVHPNTTTWPAPQMR